MSTFYLAKKLQPATKAWKSFKNHLQSKLRHNPKFSNTIITIRRRCTAAWRSIFLFIHQKVISLTRRSPPNSRRHLHHHQSNSAVYVDELFPGPVSLAEPRKNKENMDESSRGMSFNKSRPRSATETQNAGKIQTRKVEKSFPEFLKIWKKEKQKLGIDERAEEFIAKFRQDMKLEREQSLLDFEEMLKRSA
ncbi:hypothetical protein DH2020_027384 [Rehmannia glutinosa]|uniref:Uncharacterized protein n=1 Tax=Rehmannia glutinosa TaxID=99300 RepID=A0ABR0VUC4_REHGL